MTASHQHERSDALMERARRVLPGGVNSPVRAYRAVGGEPVAEGPQLDAGASPSVQLRRAREVQPGLVADVEGVAGCVQAAPSPVRRVVGGQPVGLPRQPHPAAAGLGLVEEGQVDLTPVAVGPPALR